MTTPEGQLAFPADEVTDLLRSLAAEWASWPAEEDLDLDPRTVGAMVGVLTDLADQVDVECIGLSS
ncbi:DUF6213 family protein [Kitasatospora sp. NPDC006697]|uniref:DUF6213 family protein n=1 Tax=Kitasatospora sp. NPDC006697 TaxID=3364020 RepID=UPI0036C31BAB